MGNHEEVMLRVIDGETDMLRSWLRFGGAETLASYGVDPKELKRLSSDELAKRLHKAIPEAHRQGPEPLDDLRRCRATVHDIAEEDDAERRLRMPRDLRLDFGEQPVEQIEAAVDVADNIGPVFSRPRRR
jgi:hypothetical protein